MNSFDKYGGNLIFVFSLPRSGSTLLQYILGGHPEILTLPEPWILLHPLYALKKQGIATEYESHLAQKALEGFLENCGGKETYDEAVRTMASVLYGAALETAGKKYFLDKTPRYYYIIPEIFRMFPAAKFIFLLRNPLAVFSSILHTWFNNRPDLLMKSANRFDLSKGPSLLINGMELIGEKAFVLKYEDLVTDPEHYIKKICNKFDISFDNKIINYNTGDAITSNRFGDQTEIYRKNRPVDDSVDKWKENIRNNNLSSFATNYMDTVGEPAFSKLGYDFDAARQEMEKMARDIMT